MNKLGFATSVGFGTDLVLTGLSHLSIVPETNIIKESQGDIGAIVGLYFGLHLGNAINKVVERVYSRRD